MLEATSLLQLLAFFLLGDKGIFFFQLFITYCFHLPEINRSIYCSPRKSFNTKLFLHKISINQNVKRNMGAWLFHEFFIFGNHYFITVLIILFVIVFYDFHLAHHSTIYLLFVDMFYFYLAMNKPNLDSMHLSPHYDLFLV